MLKQIPNLLTVLRLVLIPFFLFFLVQDDLNDRLIAFAIFSFSSFTDFLDGYLARKLSAESEFGRILDPLADKALVISALSAFIYLDNQIPLWMIFTIVARDILITLIRVLGKTKKIPVQTSRLAKAKTAFQMVSIFIILLVFSVRSYRGNIQETFNKDSTHGRTHSQIALEKLKEGLSLFPPEDSEKGVIKKKFAESVPYFLMLFVTILTVVSGIRYFVTNYKVFLPAPKKQ